jgi:hypothetical protein
VTSGFLIGPGYYQGSGSASLQWGSGSSLSLWCGSGSDFLMRNRIVLLIKAVRICVLWFTDPTGLHFDPQGLHFELKGLHFESSCLHSERPRPSTTPFGASKALEFLIQCRSGSSFFIFLCIRIQLTKILRIRIRNPAVGYYDINTSKLQ